MAMGCCAPVPTAGALLPTALRPADSLQYYTLWLNFRKDACCSAPALQARCVDLWRRLIDLCRIEDEPERVVLLVLFHQLEIGQPVSVAHPPARRQAGLGPAQRRGRELMPA